MRIFVAVILLPAILLGQAARVGHAHRDMTVQERVKHSSHPHVHVHGRHDHHAHHDARHRYRHDEQAPPAVPLHDHDADTVYLVSVELLLPGPGSQALSLSDFDDSSVVLVTAPPTLFCQVSVYSRTHGPPLATAGCPLYLRLLSLRC